MNCALETPRGVEHTPLCLFETLLENFSQDGDVVEVYREVFVQTLQVCIRIVHFPDQRVDGQIASLDFRPVENTIPDLGGPKSHTVFTYSHYLINGLI